jgi:GntR family transcriptional regulator / MocR family aminotransferase
LSDEADHRRISTMTKRVSAAPFPPIRLDRASPVPVHRQIYDGLRRAILEGRLKAGTQVPSTRTLAKGLGVARTTVVIAYSQLLAEGYLEGRIGSGTYVSPSLPDGLLEVRAARSSDSAREARVGGISRRGRLFVSAPGTAVRYVGEPRAFRHGVPALDEFPFGIWSRLAARRWRQPPWEMVAYGEAAGYRPLREAIADHLGAARAVRCTWEQVVVVSGAQQAFELTARVLLDPGDAVWIEDPGYSGAQAALAAAEAKLVPVPVDEEGLDVAAGEERAPEARLAFVTPSHQYPLAVTMSLPRRLALLGWASRCDAWILEDDYDSEYRYSGRPLEALQALDDVGRVIYAGTFSKVLFPALRLGYLVVPPDLVDAFAASRELSDLHPPTVEQAILADFFHQGHFARHIRRMRMLYAERQAALVEAAKAELAGLLRIDPANAGMHLVGYLLESHDDREASRRAAGHGIEASPVSASCLSECSVSPGLLLGYTAVGTREIQDGVRRLSTALS